MADYSDGLFVVTGGPGSGKTTLIEALARAGHATFAEAGRGIIRDQVAIGGGALPWSDPPRFAEMMLCWDMRSHHLAASAIGPVFLDRGIPDVLGYLHLLGRPVPAHMEKAARIFRYNPRVFVAPPWPEIFAQDSERKQTPEEAARTCETMVAAYRSCGYELVELPHASVEERVRLVLDRAADVKPNG